MKRAHSTKVMKEDNVGVMKCVNGEIQYTNANVFA